MSVSIFKYKDFVVAEGRKKVDFSFTVDKAEETFEFRESYVFESALPDCLETYRY